MHKPTRSAGTEPEVADQLVAALSADPAVAVVRAPKIPDVAGLCEALVEGGIRVVELTFTTPGLSGLLATASRTSALVGAGTVLTADDARTAVDAGARFLVTPGLGREAAEIVSVAHQAGMPAVLGAMTPSEVLSAMQHGADLVKIFPARTVGPQFCSDLHGPFPGVRLLPSGGITAANARDFLDAGALAVSAGTGVVVPSAVGAGDWATITYRARTFRESLSLTPSGASRHGSNQEGGEHVPDHT